MVVLLLDGGHELPPWLLQGLGAYTSRLDNDNDASWFGKQHVQKGGVRNLKSFFAGFAISGEMESKEIDYNIFQAGLLVAYCLHGGDAKATVKAGLTPTGPIIVNASRAVLYASKGADFVSAARSAALDLRQALKTQIL